MTTLYRHRTRFSGFPGGPGVATMYFLDTTTALDSIHALWLSTAAWCPTDLSIEIEPGGDQIDDTDGVITGAWAADPVGLITGTSANVYGAPVGAQFRWDTATILDGHRLRGRTFIVPMCSNNFTSSGAIAGSLVADLQGYADAFVASQSASFVIWHRPREAREATPKLKALTAHVGGHGLVTSSSVPAKVAVLRSRRD